MDELSLNTGQKEAVDYKDGPLLIVAGAGTGKTRVITEKIRRLIQENHIPPREILAVTFTDKAAGEMLSRIGDVMPLGYEEPSVCTFHKFSEMVLKDRGIEIGLDPTFNILSASDAYRLFKKNLFKFKLKYFRPLGNPNKFILAILKFFSRLQDEVVTPLEFSQFVEKQEEDKEKLTELAEAYTTYTQIKLDNSLMDFGDLLNWSLQLFKTRPVILREYQTRFKHIFVDEFQDTNWAQYELIKMLADPVLNPLLTVVGDDNQSIYKFRGAAISNIINFQRDYPKARLVILDQNYRSFQDILDASYRLIKNNDPDTLEARLGISKKLTSQKKAPQTPSIVIKTLDNESDEAEFVVSNIIKLMKQDPNLAFKDFAILARANTHLDPVTATLRRHLIPYQIVGNRGLFDTAEIRALLSFLRFVVDTGNNVAFYDLMSSSFLDMAPLKILEILKKSKAKKISLWESFVEDPLLIVPAKILKGSLNDAPKEAVSKILFDFITKTGWVENVIKEESLTNKLKIDNLNRFFKFIKEFESREKLNFAPGFVEYLDLAMEAGENPAQAQIEDIDTVNLLTVHGAKGLEFPVVFLISVTSDRFPTRNRGDVIEIPDALIKETLPTGDYHLEEERRLFYVGATRAKDKLFISFAKSYGGTKEKRPSGFINELKIETEKKLEENQKENQRSGQLNFLLITPRELSKLPKTVVKKALEVPFVSFSQLDMFKTCPLQYKYRYILQIQTPPNHAFTFGQSIHNTLRDFERMAILNKDKATLEELLKIYENNFDPSGYESKEHREKRFEQGKDYLKTYFEKGRKLLGNPKFIEEKFRMLIDGTPFVGVIDRVDETDEGVVIVDYKTGEAREQEKVDKDAQLTAYAIAAKEVLKLNPVKLCLYFFEDAEIVATTRDEHDLIVAKKDIAETVGKIKEGEFPAKVGPLCKYCSYNSICPAYKNYLNI